MLQAFLPDMLEQKRGHVVTIASLAGQAGTNKLVGNGAPCEFWPDIVNLLEYKSEKVSDYKSLEMNHASFDLDSATTTPSCGKKEKKLGFNATLFYDADN